MAERFNNYSTPDHLDGSLEEEEKKSERRSERVGLPTVEQAALEAYYAQPEKMPDHLGQGARDLEALPDRYREIGGQAANEQENLRQYYESVNSGDSVVANSGNIDDLSFDDAGYTLGAGRRYRGQDGRKAELQQTVDEQGSPLPQGSGASHLSVDEEVELAASVGLPNGRFYTPDNAPYSWANKKAQDQQWMADNPGLAKPLVEAGVDPDEIHQVVNFDYARETASHLTGLYLALQVAPGDTPYESMPAREMRAIYRNLNPVQRIIVQRMTEEMFTEVLDEIDRQKLIQLGAEGPKTQTPGTEAELPWTPAQGISRVWNWSINVQPILNMLPGSIRERVEDVNSTILGDGEIKPIAGTFDTYLQAADFTLDGVQAYTLYGREGIRDILDGNLGEPTMSFEEAWDLSRNGAISPETQRQLVAQYGSENVRMLNQIKEWHDQGLNAVDMAIAEFGGDNDSAAALVYALTGVVDDSPQSREIFNLLRDYDYATNDSLANILLFNEYRGPLPDAAKPLVDFTAGMVADPLLLLGPIGRVTSLSRYSVAKLVTAQADEVDDLLRRVSEFDEIDAVADGGVNLQSLIRASDEVATNNGAPRLVELDPQTKQLRAVSPAVEKMFNKKRVRRAFNVVGGILKKIEDNPDLFKRGNRLRAFYSVLKKFFPEEMLDEMRRQKVFSAEDAKYWFHDNSMVSQVVRGMAPETPPSSLMPKPDSPQKQLLDGVEVLEGNVRPLRVAESESTNPLLMVNLGQRSSPNAIMPNIGAGTAMLKLASGQGRYMTLNFLTAPQRQRLQKVVGDLTKASPEEAAIFIDALNNFPELIAAIDSDWQMYMKAGQGLDADIPITPQTAQMAADAMEMRAKALGGNVPKLVMGNTNLGKFYKFLRKVAKNGDVEKVKKGRAKMRGRALLVNGEDTLGGKKVNNVYGKQRKVIFPRMDSDYFDNFFSNFLSVAARSVDRWSRIAARYPGRTRVPWDGSDARNIYEFSRAWGMSTAFSNALREAWVYATPAQRKQMTGALAQAGLYSRGVPYIFADPKQARAYMASWGSDADGNRMYATEVLNPLTGKTYNPSVIVDQSGKRQAVALSAWQLADAGQLPDLAAVERVVARKSSLGLLLGNNPGFQAFVDLWSMATLLGPRYQIRAGIEDFVFYAFANNTDRLKRYLQGQRISGAIRDARDMKPNVAKQVGRKLDDAAFAEGRLNKIESTLLTGDDVSELARLANNRASGVPMTDVTNARLDYLLGQVPPQARTKINKSIIPSNNDVDAKVRRAVTEANRKEQKVLGGVLAGDDVPKGSAKGALSPMGVRAASELHRWAGLRRFLTTAEKAELDEASKALNMGDRTVIAKLASKAYARQPLTQLRRNKPLQSWLNKKFGIGAKNGKAQNNPKLTPEEENIERALEALFRIDRGLARFDEVSEGSDYLSTGALPPANGSGNVGGGKTQTRVISKRGPVTAENLQIDETVSNKLAETWGTIIFNKLRGDGTLAQQGLRNLQAWYNATSDKQRSRIARELVESVRNDPEMGDAWFDNFVMVGKTSKEEYVARYMDDLLNTFSRRDGSPNKALLKLLRDEDGTFNPDKIRFEDLNNIAWDEAAQGFRIDEFPKNLYDEYGVITTEDVGRDGLLGWVDRGNSSMGNSLSRLSREPIWAGNYLLAWDQLEGFRRAQAQMFIASGVPKKRAQEMADDLAADNATERATNLTLSWTDNPNVRSLAAWKVRNVSRYWRAQEDLYRRVGRMVRYRPRAVFRMALGYELLKTSGFTWEDDLGESYFIYPGASLVMSNLLSLLPGGRYADIPLNFTGEVNLLTPSGDPGAFAPTSTPGPSTVAWEIGKFLGDYFPSAQRALDMAEPMIFGTYGAPSFDDMSILPYNLRRLVDMISFNTSSEAERLAMGRNFFAESSVMATRALMAAGRIPNVAEMGPRERYDTRKEVEKVAFWVATIRTAAGFFEPARTRVSGDQISSFARDLGVTSWRPEFIDLIDANDGDWSMALVDFIETFPEFAPFTVRSTEAADAGNVPYGRAQSSIEAANFLNENYDLLEKYPTALPYLAPYGPSEQEGYVAVAELGLTEKRPSGEVMDDLFFAKPIREKTILDNYLEDAIEGYDEMFANGDISLEQYNAAVAASEDMHTAEIDKLKDANPGLNDALERRAGSAMADQTDEVEDSAVAQFRGAVEDLEERNVKIPVTPGSNVNKVRAGRTVLNWYDAAVGHLQKLAAEADDYGITESRRREQIIISRFEDQMDNNFGFSDDVNIESLIDFTRNYLLPSLKRIHTE